MKLSVLSVACVASAFLPSLANAETLVLNPTSDGSLYTCAGCSVVSDGAYVLTSGYIQGAVKFSSATIEAPVTQALLTLNPYGLPLFGPELSIYGYGTAIGPLDISDANAGQLIGVFTLPEGLGYGQDAYFDVTTFVSSTVAPYLAFNIRSVGTNVFSSLEYNYGHPSQLHITTAVPEASVFQLLTVGLLALALRMRSPRRSVAAA